ncbi:protein transporter Sec31 [Actinacidiphila sp. DG2A-62]|uniref:protein transporter Sec31 n=1 Tax=Actinacidiphila sp. DG2A-62 TaxID=3108821 RepID=UPI002DBEF23F|nr:protein transporter Sec31 [Actinacidiphila sp. DG2A-62]MEC3995017.1 protein transporter Sec31 [Actinacidiphila sp. DG2A-62]
MSTPGTSPDTPQPRIPGVRYRTETRERLVPETVNGETRLVPETYQVDVPVPPRDMDRIILRAVTCAAVLVTGLSVAWTTAGIGALLAPVVPDVIAYGVAGVFDLAWLCCQALEWLERYDPKRANVARGAGWAALVIAVAAVVAHGVDVGDSVGGSVGAAVSVIAKGLWVVVLRHYSVPLGERVGGWLLLRRREVTAQRALSGELRRLAADEAYSRAVFGDLAASAAQATTGADLDPSAKPVPIEAPAPPVAPPAPPVVPPSPAPGPMPSNVTRLDTGSPSIADTIRDCLAHGISETPDVIARVREVHGDSDTLDKTVARTLRRIRRGNAS